MLLPLLQPRRGGAGSLSAILLQVYAFVMTADWLQGPYIFSLCAWYTLLYALHPLTPHADHDEYKYSLEVVAALFVLGFLSAGIFAPFIGDWCVLPSHPPHTALPFSANPPSRLAGLIASAEGASAWSSRPPTPFPALPRCSDRSPTSF